MLNFRLVSYRRDVVDDRTRELCTVAALTVQGFALPELKVHIKGALNTGSTKAEVLEIITQMIAYCGFPAATNALLAAQEVFSEIERTAPQRYGKLRHRILASMG